MAAPRPAYFTLLLSLAFHLVAFYLVGLHWEEVEESRIFRAYFLQRPRFEPPPPFAKPAEVQTQMEYLPPLQPGAPAEAPEVAGTPTPSPTPVEGPELPRLAGIEPGGPPKPAAPVLAEEQRPAVAGPVRVDTLESEAMELLRIEDMARVDDKRAVIIFDQYSRRDLEGFINFTYLYLDGIGNRGGAIEKLARFLRDNTKIRARVRGVPKPYFLSPELLKDPIHFMFPGRRLGGAADGRSTHLSPKELDLLRRYVREGGFLFVEGAAESQWLEEMIVYLYQVTRPNGRLFEIPFTHPIYHSYYDYDNGFPPGEEKELIGVPLPSWYFSQGKKDRRGMWGVELDGQLIAVISDMGLAERWSAEVDAAAFLSIPVNVVFYALTRPGGLTSKRRPSAWKTAKPPTAVATPILDPREDPDEDEVFEQLEANLALVHLPLTEAIDRGGLRLKLDGRHSVELLQPGKNGLLLHNLKAGPHWIEVEYRGQKEQLEVDLVGGTVVTVGFRLERFGFIKRLKLKERPEKPETATWRRLFANLSMEPVFFDEGELIDLLEE